MKNFFVGLFIWITGIVLFGLTLWGGVTLLDWLSTVLSPEIAVVLGATAVLGFVFGPIIIDEVIPGLQNTGKLFLAWRDRK